MVIRMMTHKKKQYNTWVLTFPKITPIQASLQRMKDMVTKISTKNERKQNQKVLLVISSEQQIPRKHFRKEIQGIGHINCVKLQKLMVRQYPVMALIFYQSVIMKPC